LIFVAPKNVNYQFIARHEEADHMMGFKRITKRQLVADFGYISAPEFPDEEGKMQAVIQGGVFDSEDAQKRLNWSDEERQIVEQRLLELILNPPDGASRGDVALYEPPKPTPPWPTYDSVHHNKIPTLAGELGLIEQAITYEQRTKRRESVLRALEAKRLELEGAEELVAQ
jgi:hypothetical protein